MLNVLRKITVYVVLGAMISFAFLSLTETAKAGNDVEPKTSGTTLVSYVKTDTVAYRLTVKVNGYGTVEDEKKSIRNAIEYYTLPIDEEKVFNVKADEGKRIEKIELNGKNIKESDSVQEVIVGGAEKNQTLVVEFEEEKSLITTPKTGELIEKGTYILLLVISMIGMTFAMRKKTRE